MTSITVTATAVEQGSNKGLLLRVKVLTGAKPAAQQPGGTGGNAVNGAVSFDQSLTIAATGSYVYGACSDWTNDTSFTADSVTTLIDNYSDTTNVIQHGTFRSASTTSSTGSQTYGCTAPTGNNGAVSVAEILAATTLAEDASGPVMVANDTALAVTTASFSPPAGSLLVALICANTGNTATTMSVSDSSGLTWTALRQESTNASDYAGIFIAQVPAAATVSALVNTAPPQRTAPLFRVPPQVITGPAGGTVNVSSSDSGHGAGAAIQLKAIPAAQASGHGSGATAHIALNSADTAHGTPGVPVIRPQAAGTADSAHSAAQGAIQPEAAGTGRGTGAAAFIKPEAGGTGSGHGNSAVGVSSTDSGHGAGAVTSLNTGVVIAGAIRAIPRPFAPARISPQVITGPAGAGPVVITSAGTGRGTGSDFFFISAADSAVGAGHGVTGVSSAGAGHGTGASLSRWLTSAGAGTGHGAALSRWPVSADAGRGSGRALSAWPSSAGAGRGSGALPGGRLAVSAAATAHGTDSYGDLGIWTLLPPSWSERRGLVWIIVRIADGELLELVRGLPPSRELLELARQVSSGPVRHIRAADCGRARAAAAGCASVTLWVTEAAQVAVWVEEAR